MRRLQSENKYIKEVESMARDIGLSVDEIDYTAFRERDTEAVRLFASSGNGLGVDERFDNLAVITVITEHEAQPVSLEDFRFRIARELKSRFKQSYNQYRDEVRLAL